MGIDYYSCKRCDESFPDVIDYVYCECGNNWCDNECAEADGWREEEEGFTPKGSKYEQETSCKYCRGEEFYDDDLLNFALEKLSLSREELITQYKKII